MSRAENQETEVVKRPRITVEQAEQVECLLALGLSHRQVAAKTGVSKASVSNIATGRWRPPIEPEDESPYEELETPRRCKNCGALVNLWPCVACDLCNRRQAPDAKQKRHDPRCDRRDPPRGREAG